MKIRFQLLDADYILVDSTPIVRLIGKNEKGDTVTVFCKGFYPYFYVLPKAGKYREVENFIKSEFSSNLLKIEKVEKFDPIGFKEKPYKMLKVVLIDPSKTPEIRDKLVKKKDIVEKVYEADILFKYRFMADYNLSGMKWYEVIGRGTSTNTVKTKIRIEGNQFKEIDIHEQNLKYLSVDIEVAETHSKTAVADAEKDPISIISLSFYPDFNGKKNLVLVAKPVKRFSNEVIPCQNEKDLLEKFMEILDKFDPDIITGYNINEFDIPYIITRLRKNKISPLLGRVKDKKAHSRKVGSRHRNSIPGRIIVDVYELIKEAVSKGIFRFKRYGLGDVAKELIGEGKVDVAHSEISKLWKGSEEDMKKLIRYARKDAILALRILLEKRLLDKFFELSRLSGLLLQDVLDMGEAARIENFLLREFNKENFVLPLKPSSEEILRRKEERLIHGLKGALVLDPKTGLHTTNVVYLDFKSMYPSIFIAFNICPTTLLLKERKDLEYIETPTGTKFVSKKVREGIIPRILRRLIKERDEVKKQMKKEKNEEIKRILNAKQLALKIMANAFYGYTGYLRARLYVLTIANAITGAGRYFISTTKQIVEEDPRFQVVYGDTDSVMVKVPTTDIEKAFEIGKMLERKINERMKGKITIKIEAVFKTLLILSKKRYAGLQVEPSEDGYKEKIVMKGIETVRRDWCDLTSKTLKKVLEILLKEQNVGKAFDYVKEILKKLEKNEIPLEELVITKSISKNLNEYKGIQPHIELIKKMRKRKEKKIPGVGDRIGFVIIQGPELVSKRAEDPDYVRKHNLKIDSKYYIESQILPPLERVFEVIGINKSQLFGAGRQMLIKDLLKNGVEKKKPQIEEALSSIEGFSCLKCGKFFRRIPLTGRCDECGGEVLFFYQGKYSKVLIH